MLHRILAVVTFAVTVATGTLRAGDRPKVLIIGDSISIGYTPHVVSMMKDRADVVHSPGNSQHTGTGLRKLDSWLKGGPWDVIHFNWGLWDLCYRHPDSRVQGHRDKQRGTLTTSLQDYENNLEQLVKRLRRTGAVLIWASTTVVPEGEAGRKLGDDLRYNEVAARVMRRHGVRINDLNAVSREFGPELFVAPGNVHFTSAGYERLAEHVVRSVDSALADVATRKQETRILFGSCIKQQNPVPILQTIVADRPDMFLFLGDNIYGDTEDMNVLQQKYDTLRDLPGFQRLMNSTRVLATWDDHDYGANDSGADYPMREQSERIFEQFWYADQDAPCRHRPGVYDSFVFGPSDRRVQLILLDTRFFRSPLTAGEKRVGGQWVPDNDPEKTMLGERQWDWLEKQLRQPARVRVIASSIQFLAEDAGQETWSNLPRERSRMLKLIEKTQANGVVFVSGDRHWAEISMLDEDVPYPLLDVTSSSLNQVHARGTPTKNRYRLLPETWHRENYGAIVIRWLDDPEMILEIRDLNGQAQLRHSVSLSALNP